MWSFIGSMVTQTVKNLPEVQETQMWFLSWKDPLEEEMATRSSIFAWRIPWTEEPGRLQPMGPQRVGHNWAWWAAVRGVPKRQTQLSDFTFTFHFHALEKEMATHSGVLAWRIPGMGEPGGLPSMGSQQQQQSA